MGVAAFAVFLFLTLPNGTAVLAGDDIADFIGFESQGLGPANAGQGDHIVEFFYALREFQPVFNVATFEIDHKNATTGFGFARCQ